MFNNQRDIEPFLQQTRLYLETLIAGIPKINGHLKACHPTLSLAHPEILEQIPLTITILKGKPVVTIAFCGPSGAGKSTIFNLLTSLKIPAGGAVRPMTYASLAVAPEPLANCMPWNDMFPGFELADFAANTDLRNPSSPAHRLFTGYFKPNISHDNFWPCIIDVPDFNTTAISNWEKADYMLKRADSVIFTVYHESYKSQKTFSMLKRVLLLSGSVVYLLTKLDEEHAEQSAREIYGDLLTTIEGDPDFQQTRSDGTTLVDFFKTTPFYYSPYDRNPSLHKIKALSQHDPAMDKQIFGQKGLEVLLSRQLQAVVAGINTSEAICQSAITCKMQLTEKIDQVKRRLQITSEKITGEEFPVFHILAMIRKLLEENRPTLLRRALKPLLMLGSGLKAVVIKVKDSIKGISGKDLASGVLLRNDLERTRLETEVEKLISDWHNNPDFQGLATEQLRTTASRFLAIELPAVDSEWEKSVVESLRDWQNSNKNLWLWLNIINDVFILLGTGLFLADFFLDGGIGTLGVVAVIGGSSATGGLLLSLFNNMGLGNQILQAHKSWKAQRQKEYVQHLRINFAGPLFLDNLLETNKNLDTELIESCRNSCQRLKEIIRQNEQQ